MSALKPYTESGARVSIDPLSPELESEDQKSENFAVNDHSNSQLEYNEDGEEYEEEAAAPPCLSETCSIFTIDVATGRISARNKVAKLTFEDPSVSDDGDSPGSSTIGLYFSSLFRKPGKMPPKSSTNYDSGNLDPDANSLAGSNDSLNNQELDLMEDSSAGITPSSVKFIKECATITAAHAVNQDLMQFESWPWTRIRVYSNGDGDGDGKSTSSFILYHENPNLVAAYNRTSGECMYFSHWILKDSTSDYAVCLLQQVCPMPKLALSLDEETLDALMDSFFARGTLLDANQQFIRTGGGDIGPIISSIPNLIKMSRFGLVTYCNKARVLGWRVDQVMDKPLMRFIHDKDVGRLCECMASLGKAVYSMLTVRWLLDQTQNGQQQQQSTPPFVWVKILLIKISEMPFAVIEQITDLETLTELFSKVKTELEETSQRDKLDTIVEEDEDGDEDGDGDDCKASNNGMNDDINDGLCREESAEDVRIRKQREREKRSTIRCQHKWITCVGQKLQTETNTLVGAWNEAQLVLSNSNAAEDWMEVINTISRLISSQEADDAQQRLRLDYQQKNFITEALLILCGLDGLKQEILFAALGFAADLQPKGNGLNIIINNSNNDNIPLEQIWHKLLSRIHFFFPSTGK